MDSVMPNAHRDVRGTSKDWRVTESHRGSARVFVAPEQAPVATTSLEQAKGARDWTDMDTKPTVVDGDTLARQAKLAAERHEAMSMTVGTVVPNKRSQRKLHTVSLDTSDREYEQYRALLLAAREYYGN